MAPRIKQIEIEYPPWFAEFLLPRRIKSVSGGRASGKTYSFGTYFATQGAKRKIKVLCCREYQSSMKDSVYALLVEIINKYKLNHHYTINRDNIIGANGTEFIFIGLKTNIDNVKSYQGIDYCWVEEASTVSDTTWRKLLPTIRADNSEIWLSWNPEFEDDATYKRFALKKWDPEIALIKTVNYWDNPWFAGSVLAKDMEADKKDNYQEYLHVWEGQCISTGDGLVYLDYITRAKNEGRIKSVPIDRSHPVHTFWDLGWADLTAIWFAQIINGEYRIVDYIQANNTTIQEWAIILQDKHYYYGAHYLPHDADHKNIMTGLSTIEIMRKLGWNVKLGQKISIADGINAGREMLNKCVIDEVRCEEGLRSLRKYSYDVRPGMTSRNPKHDDSSHGADAWRYLALSLKPVKQKAIIDYSKFERPTYSAEPGAWLAY